MAIGHHRRSFRPQWDDLGQDLQFEVLSIFRDSRDKATLQVDGACLLPMGGGITQLVYAV